MTTEQLAVVHVVNLIPGHNQDMLAVARFDQVQILEHGVCRTSVSLATAWRQTDDLLATIAPKLIT